MLCAQLRHGASFPLWYETAGQPCLCGKAASALADELAAGRAAAAADRARNTRSRGELQLVRTKGCSQDRTRMGLLHAHLAVPGVSSVLRPLVEPTAASVNAMAELLREFISIPSVRRPCVFVPGGAPCHAVRADADDHRVALRSTQVNPDQVAKAGTNPLDDPNCGEHAYATCLASKFEELGCEVILEDCTNGWAQAVEGFAPRSNIYVVLQSKKNPDAKWLAIDTHLDTVMVTGMQPFGPFDGTMTPDGKIHGRGACDTKATFAIVLSILQEMHQSAGSLDDFPVNLVLAGTAGEETGRLGANYFREFLLARGYYIDEMLVAEPTLCTPITGHKGGVGLEFKINGVAAHSSKPHLGKNALVAAADLIMRMMEEHETVQARGGPLGAPTITPTLASGGHGPNIVPQNASVYIDYRITTATADDGSVSEDCQAVVDRLIQIAHEVLDDSEHCTGFEVENNNDDGLAGNPSFYQDPDAPWVRQLAKWSGMEPEVVTFGTNATAYSAPAGQGVPAKLEVAESEAAPVAAEPVAAVSAAEGRASVYGTCVVMGPGDISQAHMADEWIEVEQLAKMKGILEQWFQL